MNSRVVSSPRLQARIYAVLALTSAVALAGCRVGEPHPTAVPVKGTITYKGQPVVGAFVMFIPKEGKQATATTKDDGSYVLSTYDKEDGTVPGEYTVVIEKRGPAPGNDPYATRPSEIPEHYSSPQTSGEKRTVSDKFDNKFDFDLKDK